VTLFVCGYVVWSILFFPANHEEVEEDESPLDSAMILLVQQRSNVTTRRLCLDGKTFVTQHPRLVKASKLFLAEKDQEKDYNLDYWSHRAVLQRRQDSIKNHDTRRQIYLRNNSNNTVAVHACRFHPKYVEKLQHFAHAMEQIYLCLDYWIGATDRQNLPKQLYLLFNATDQAQPWKMGIEKTPFLKGVMDVLETQLRLQQMTLQDFMRTKGLTIDTGHPTDYTPQSMIDAIPTFRDPLGGFLFQSTHAWNDMVAKHYQITTRPVQRNDTCTLPRIRILSRKTTRRIINADRIAKMLNGRTIHALHKQENIVLRNVQVEYFENTDFVQQFQTLQNTDILITSHGAQLTGLPMMVEPTAVATGNGTYVTCKQLLELYPKNYAIPYYFGSLAVQSGIAHSYMYLQDEQDGRLEHENDNDPTILFPWENRNADTYEERRQSRQVSLCPDTNVMVEAIIELVRDWHTCCISQSGASGQAKD
jgi:hypothetical protein